MRLVELRAICVIVQDNQHLVQFLHLQLLGRLGDLALPLGDAPQRCLVPLVVVGLLALRVHLLDGDPAIVDVYAGAKNVERLRDRIMLVSATVLPGFDAPRKMPGSSRVHLSAPKRAVTKRCGETVFGPRFGTVTRAYGDMAWALVSGAVRFLPGTLAG